MCLEKSKFWSHLTAAFQYLKWLQEGGRGTFHKGMDKRMRRDGFKLIEGGLKLDTRKKFFTLRALKHWNRCVKNCRFLTH